MISAPMSPSSRPVNGPASSMPSSTTRTPASGPGPAGVAGRCVAAAGRPRVTALRRPALGSRSRDAAATSRSRASKTCSFMTSSARSASRVASAFDDLPVVVRRDPLLVGRVPDVRLVDERQLDHLAHHAGEPRAPGGVEDRVVEEEVLATSSRSSSVATRRASKRSQLSRSRSTQASAMRRRRAARRVALEQRAQLVEVVEVSLRRARGRSRRGSAPRRPGPRPGASAAPRGPASG